MPAKEREIWVDVAKGICILLVVMHHTIAFIHIEMPQFEPSSLVQVSTRLWELINLHLTPARMPVFMFLSGYLSFNYIFKRQWSIGISNRVIDYLWLIVVWSAFAWFLSHILITLFNYHHDWHERENLVEFSPTVESFFTNLVLGNGYWYPYALAIYYVVAKAAQKYIVVATACSLALFIYLTQFDTSYMSWGVRSILRNLVFYLVGAYFGKAIVGYFSQVSIGKLCLLAGVVLFALFSIKVLHISRLYFGSIAAIVACVCFGQWFKQYFHLKCFSWLAYVGVNSLLVYVLHFSVLQLVDCFLVNSQAFKALLNNESAYTAFIIMYPITLTLIVAAISLVIGHFLRSISPIMFSAQFLRERKRMEKKAA